MVVIYSNQSSFNYCFCKYETDNYAVLIPIPFILTMVYALFSLEQNIN